MNLLFFLAFFVALVAGENFYQTDPNVFELTPLTFDDVIFRSNYTTIVKFYASWCGHCKLLKPIYHKLARFINQDAKYAVNVASVNCQEKANNALCIKHRIDLYPTIVVFRPPKYDDLKPDPKARKGTHITERYNGERAFRPMVDFLTSRIKNYVKKVSSPESIVFEEFLGFPQQFKVLLVSASQTLSPMYKSLAVDFLGDIKFGMISSKEKAVGISQWNTTVDSTPALLLHDDKTGKTTKFAGKLKDKLKISEWLVEETGIKPHEGQLSDKEKNKLFFYRLHKRVPKKRGVKKTQSHDEL